ncbi:MAG TPA: hypothetical protein VFE46_19720 [Pirellulales bacterium]|jgi:hypothetical protein|nr:hypothetical protein [Pirellulales bacterium]
MNRTARWIGSIALVVLAGTVLYRGAITAARTEGGWNILGEQLVAGLPHLFAGQQSSDQIWYRAKQRLMDAATQMAAEPQATAADCMGMAWLLAGATSARTSPDPAIVGRIMWGLPPENPNWNKWQQVNRQLLERAQELAAQATQRQPRRNDWWRLRALLMLRPEYRQSDVNGLQEGAAHDPDNALYEYLLASEKMNRAFATRATDDGPAEYLADEPLFAAGQHQYEWAAHKPALWCGEAGLAAVGPALRAIAAPLPMKLTWSNAAEFEQATLSLVQHISSLINDDYLSPAEQIKWRNWLAKNQTWSQQLVIEPKTLWMRTGQASSMGSNPSQAALMRQISMVSAREENLWQASALYSIAAVAAAVMAIMFLLLALVSWIGVAVWRAVPQAPIKTGLVLAPLLLGAVLALTYEFLGMAPAYEPTLRKNPWQVGAFFIAAGIALAWLLVRMGRFAWRQSRLASQERAAGYQPARWTVVVGVSLMSIVALFSVIDVGFRAGVANILLKFPANLFSHKVDFVTV